MIWDKRVGLWVGQQLFGNPQAFGNYQSLGVFVDGALAAGVVFHDWHEEWGTMEVSCFASDPRWFRRDVIKEAMDYAFNWCGVQMLLVRTAKENTRARRIWRALGSTETLIPRLYGRDRDGAILTLTDDAWRASRFYEAD